MNIKKLARSFGYAIDGLRLAVVLDQNVRFHLITGVLVLLAAIILQAPKLDLMFVVFAIFFVIICEMINTAIEEMTNLIKIEHSREARIAKDVAAGAVLLSAVFAIVVGILVLLPRLIALF